MKKGNYDNYNYPLGSDADPNCPWRREDPEEIPFEEDHQGDCEYCSAESVMLNEKNKCAECYEADPECYEEDDVIFDKGYED